MACRITTFSQVRRIIFNNDYHPGTILILNCAAGLSETFSYRVVVQVKRGCRKAEMCQFVLFIHQSSRAKDQQTNLAVPPLKTHKSTNA